MPSTTEFDVKAYGKTNERPLAKSETMWFIISKLLLNGKSDEQINNVLKDHRKQPVVFKAHGELSERDMGERIRQKKPLKWYYVKKKYLVYFNGETFAICNQYGGGHDPAVSDKDYLELIRGLSTKFPEARIFARETGDKDWEVKPDGDLVIAAPPDSSSERNSNPDTASTPGGPTEAQGESDGRTDRMEIPLGLATSDVRTPPPLRVSPVASRRTTISEDNDWSDICLKRQRIGDAGEQFVLELERNELRRNKRNDLADRVAKVLDGVGYDISSFFADGKPKNIEVKTTAGLDTEPFYLTLNEVDYSQKYPSEFVLFRVYDFNGNRRLYELGGDLTKAVDLVPIVYRATPSSN